MKNIFLFFIGVLASSIHLFAGLEFERRMIEDEISSLSDGYDFSFRFENTGECTFEVARGVVLVNGNC